jgi:hypothetical protein
MDDGLNDEAFATRNFPPKQQKRKFGTTEEIEIVAERSSPPASAGAGILTLARTKTTKPARPLGISLKC